MAGAGRRTFSPGEVLTASNVMNYLQDQAVMNFAGTAARGSAIGTAVSEGMVSYLADSNVVQAYDGSAWNSLAYSTAIPTVGLKPVVPSGVTVSGGSGSYDSTTGLVTFSGVSSVSINGVFSSAYSNHRILINPINGSTNAGFTMQLRSGSTNYTAQGYVFQGTYINTSGSVSGIGSTDAGATYWQLGWVAGGTTARNTHTVDLYNPSSSTLQKAYSCLSSSYVIAFTAGFVTSSSSYDGFTLGLSGTFSGTVKVYGYN